MFRWYRKPHVCFTYRKDGHTEAESPVTAAESVSESGVTISRGPIPAGKLLPRFKKG